LLHTHKDKHSLVSIIILTFTAVIAQPPPAP